VRTNDDREKAIALAKKRNKRLAFVAIPLRRPDSYAAYFDELDTIGFPRSVPMLARDRSKYRLIAPYTPDVRVKELLARG
jgi:hypothetical protein